MRKRRPEDGYEVESSAYMFPELFDVSDDCSKVQLSPSGFPFPFCEHPSLQVKACYMGFVELGESYSFDARPGHEAENL